VHVGGLACMLGGWRACWGVGVHVETRGLNLRRNVRRNQRELN
jgi:hypothetical protein